MTREEIEKKYKNEIKERKDNEKREIQELLKSTLSLENIEVTEIRENSENYNVCVKFSFTLDGYNQSDIYYWDGDESIEEFAAKVKKHIDYIKELRSKYPELCKQNDFIQSNSHFKKTLVLTHMGYNKEYYFNIKLADYMKLPNTTDCSCGGGDYEIKRTPKRVEEYNNNIDKTIDFLIDCIAELKFKKLKSTVEVEE